MKWTRKFDWKYKLIGSLYVSVILIMSLLFYTTYIYFVKKLETSNEENARLTFSYAEKELEDILKQGEFELFKYAGDDMVWRYIHASNRQDVMHTNLVISLVESFESVMLEEDEVVGLGILSGNGYSLFSSGLGKTRHSEMDIRGRLGDILSSTKANYPYVTWVSSTIFDTSTMPMGIILESPGLIGIRSLGEGFDIYADSFLVIAIDEEKIEQIFSTVVLNSSSAILVNEDGLVMADRGSDMLGTIYIPSEDTQNIEYPLSYSSWKMYNIIPKSIYMQEARNIRNFGMIIIIVALILVGMISFFWNRHFTYPLQYMLSNMQKVRDEDFDIEKPQMDIGWAELRELNEKFYVMIQSLKGYIERLHETQNAKSREELLALQYQMNPHFLYNSLNSIRWMAMMTNNTVVADALVKLVKLIMPILRNPKLTWEIKDEIEFLDSYVALMYLRYGDDLEYSIDCEESLYAEQIPRFILQPLIENAFIHGKGTDTRRIWVHIQKRDRMEIEVKNTGTLLSEEELHHMEEMIQTKVYDAKHVGLASIRRRLEILYGEFGKIWFSYNKDTCLTIHIVYKNAEDREASG